MTAPAIPQEETTEGNVTEIDLENRHILIEDRTGTPFMKLFWHKAQEEFDGKPTKLFNDIRKLQKGYYVAPVIKDQDTSASGKIKEAYIVSLPYKQRPEDFPRQQQRKGGYGGGRAYVPKNDKIMAYECTYKANAAIIQEVMPVVDLKADWDPEKYATIYNALMDMVIARALKDGAELCKAGGA